MDTSSTITGIVSQSSVFSLKAAAELIRPYLKELPFRPLSSYVLSTSHQDMMIDNTKVMLMFCTQGTMIPSALLHSDLVQGFTLDLETESYASKPNSIRKIKHRRLLFQRTESGGDYGHWFLQTTVFAPQVKRQLYFMSTRSEVVPIDADLDRALCSERGFVDKFWQMIVSWVDESIGYRQKTLSRLRRFSSECDERITDPKCKRKGVKITTAST